MGKGQVGTRRAVSAPCRLSSQQPVVRIVASCPCVNTQRRGDPTWSPLQDFLLARQQDATQGVPYANYFQHTKNTATHSQRQESTQADRREWCRMPFSSPRSCMFIPRAGEKRARRCKNCRDSMSRQFFYNIKNIIFCTAVRVPLSAV